MTALRVFKVDWLKLALGVFKVDWVNLRRHWGYLRWTG